MAHGEFLGGLFPKKSIWKTPLKPWLILGILSKITREKWS